MIRSVVPALLAVVSTERLGTLSLQTDWQCSSFILLSTNINPSSSLESSDSCGHRRSWLQRGCTGRPSAHCYFLDLSIISLSPHPLLSTAFRPFIPSQSIQVLFYQGLPAFGPRISRIPATNIATTIPSMSSMDQLSGPVSVAFPPEAALC